MNNKQIKELSLAGIYMAICSLLVMVQIPVYSFLALDFSLAILILARRQVGIKYATIIAVASPWFAMLGYWPTDSIAISIMITLNVTVIYTEYILDFAIKNKRIFKDIIIASFSILFITMANMLLYYPAYYGFDYEVFFSTWIVWFTLSMVFNSLKVIVNITLAELITIGLKKVNYVK